MFSENNIFMKWYCVILNLKEHPESRREVDRKLLDLQEDDNPVVMILKVND